MAKLIYFMPTSLDGYIADEPGPYDWSAPDDEVFAFINDLERPIGIYLYGRKIYETMAIWGTPDIIPGRTPAMMDFARIWQAADKIVYSKSLENDPNPSWVGYSTGKWDNDTLVVETSGFNDKTWFDTARLYA